MGEARMGAAHQGLRPGNVRHDGAGPRGQSILVTGSARPPRAAASRTSLSANEQMRLSMATGDIAKAT